MKNKLLLAFSMLFIACMSFAQTGTTTTKKRVDSTQVVPLDTAVSFLILNSNGATRRLAKSAIQGQIDNLNGVVALKANASAVDTAKANIRSEMSSNINYVSGQIDAKVAGDTIIRNTESPTNTSQQSIFSHRISTGLLDFPVPSLSPVQDNQVQAFDIFPKGTPSNLGGTGGVVAWADIVDTDIKRNNDPYNALRLGIGTDRVQMGSIYSGDATLKPIDFIHGGKTIMKFSALSVNTYPYAEFGAYGIKSLIMANVTGTDTISKISWYGQNTGYDIGFAKKFQAPDYAQLDINSNTGVVLNGGVQFTKSGVWFVAKRPGGIIDTMMRIRGVFTNGNNSPSTLVRLDVNAKPFSIAQNGSDVFNIATTGAVSASNSISTPVINSSAAKTPTSSSDSSGAVGDIARDDNYIYVKTSAGWKRASLSTF